MLGNVVGIELGFNVGAFEGKNVGAFEGDAEGLEVFTIVGGADELTTGSFDGVMVGLGVMPIVGSRVKGTEGEEVKVSLTAFLATIFFGNPGGISQSLLFALQSNICTSSRSKNRHRDCCDACIMFNLFRIGTKRDLVPTPIL